MRLDDAVIDDYLRAAARHGATAEVRLRVDEREELVVHSGLVDSTSTVRAGTVTVRLWRDGRTALAVVPRTADAESVVADALANSYEAAPRQVTAAGGTGSGGTGSGGTGGGGTGGGGQSGSPMAAPPATNADDTTPGQDSTAETDHTTLRQDPAAGTDDTTPEQDSTAETDHTTPGQDPAAGTNHTTPEQDSTAETDHTTPGQDPAAGTNHTTPRQDPAAGNDHTTPEQVAVGGPGGGGRSASRSLAELRAEAAALTSAGDVLTELWINQVSRSVVVASTGGGRRGYRTSSGSLLYRATRDAAGRRTHVDREDIGPDAAFLLGRLPALVAGRCGAVLRAPTTTSAPPSAVVLDGAVAARLVFLFARSLCADSVAQGRSRLAGLVGTRILSASLTLVDDPLARDAPLHAPFDDEGTPTARRVLVDRGVLTGFLGSREHASPVAGNAWQEGPSVPPRPMPGNLWIEPGSGAAVPDGAFLRVVQAYGMHLSNDITGDFSMGVTALVEQGGEVCSAEGLTVAGNVFAMLERAHPLATELTWSGGGSSYCASPDLLVEGLTVGV
ncbi:metallopeptidase TldD-related protein [Umezawaea sp.]|uniref:metallopeptidase TldD-related protein n=1 Tax=Umezawaea sp. TaxID=1955258 RepID=UPI002ED61D83